MFAIIIFYDDCSDDHAIVVLLVCSLSVVYQTVWAAVLTFNPYLLISLNEIIDINNSFIDINKYGHSIHLY